jgi:hypothetical protein
MEYVQGTWDFCSYWSIGWIEQKDDGYCNWSQVGKNYIDWAKEFRLLLEKLGSH